MQRLTRRDVVRGTTLALAGAAISGPAAVAAVTASRSGAPPNPRRPRAAAAVTPAEPTAEVPEAFDEMYLGRHIEGWPAGEDHDGHGGHGQRRGTGGRGGGRGTGGHGGVHGGHTNRAAAEAPGPVEFVVRVDDDDLHVMQNADGSWISVVNHYETHDTPQGAARAAVRELHDASLVPVTV